MGFITFDIIIMKLIKLNKKCKLIIIIIKYDLFTFTLKILVRDYHIIFNNNLGFPDAI